MTRREGNLRRRLARATDKARRECSGKPFVWGDDDCVLFHANVERSVTGRDPAAKWRGRYTTIRGAHRILGKGGLPGAMRRTARANGCKAIEPGRARVGDIGLVPMGFGFSVVRLLHRNEWIGRNNGGWSVVPTERVRFAWSAF